MIAQQFTVTCDRCKAMLKPIRGDAFVTRADAEFGAAQSGWTTYCDGTVSCYGCVDLCDEDDLFESSAERDDAQAPLFEVRQ